MGYHVPRWRKGWQGRVLAFAACVLAVACMHRLADAVMGGQLSYTIPAKKREEIVCRSLLPRARAVLASPEPMLSRLVRGFITMAFTACVLAVACMHSLADAVKARQLSYMPLAMERELSTCRSLLPRARAVVADPEPMLSRLVRGCIALAFTACVLAVACMHRFADAVKGGQLSYMPLAMERELSTCRSLLPRARAVVADPEPMLSRLLRGCIALAFTACILTVACIHHLADAVKDGELSYMALAMEREQPTCRSLLPRARAVLAGPEPMLSRLVRGCIALTFTACVRAVACDAGQPPAPPC